TTIHNSPHLHNAYLLSSNMDRTILFPALIGGFVTIAANVRLPICSNRSLLINSTLSILFCLAFSFANWSARSLISDMTTFQIGRASCREEVEVAGCAGQCERANE